MYDFHLFRRAFFGEGCKRWCGHTEMLRRIRSLSLDIVMVECLCAAVACRARWKWGETR